MQGRPRATFVAVFAAAFAVVYVLSVQYNWALFSYGPATGEFGLLTQAASAGPTMYWYGWMLTSALAAAAIAAIASVLPFSRPLWPGVAWVVPVAAILAMGYMLRGYFLR